MSQAEECVMLYLSLPPITYFLCSLQLRRVGLMRTQERSMLDREVGRTNSRIDETGGETERDAGRLCLYMLYLVYRTALL